MWENQKCRISMRSEVFALIIAPPWNGVILENMLRGIGNFKIVGKFQDPTLVASSLDDERLYYVFTELETPQSDGMRCLELLKNKKNVKIVIVSKLLRYSSHMLFEELKRFNPVLMSPAPSTKCEMELLSKAITEKLTGGGNEVFLPKRSYILNVEKISGVNGFITIIGGSTGALAHLYEILDMFKPCDNSSTVIALHTIKSRNIIEKINRICGSHVVDVKNLEKFELGEVYVLRSGRNYQLVLRNGDLYFRTFKTQLALRYRPSINLIMENFSAIFRERCTGVILSGYGNDGILGSKLIALRGGRVIVQDPSTAEVPIMPQSAIKAIEELGKIPEIIKL